MPDTYQALLDSLPEAAVQANQEKILYSNRLARHYIPQLTADAALPDFLTLPFSTPSGEGTFTDGLSRYTFHRSEAGEETQLFLFHPAPQAALTELQLDGVVRGLRSLLGEFAVELGPLTAAGQESLSPSARARFLKSYHRTFRLVSNLDFMCQAGGPSGLPFQPITMDLAGLCHQVCQAASGLLGQADVRLIYDTKLTSLLIPGDPVLLQRMLLTLIANAARAVKGGQVILRLRSQRRRAVIALSDSAKSINPRQLAAMLHQDTNHALPRPEQGAGLGLPIARHIVDLHKGALLVEWGQSSPTVLIALPSAPLDTGLPVHTAAPDFSGGLSPVLVELSDILPAEAFALEGLD